jgi:hypothetical protein
MGTCFQSARMAYKAMSLRDADLERLKTDALLDPIRNEARFQAIERQLKFPE